MLHKSFLILAILGLGWYELQPPRRPAPEPRAAMHTEFERSLAAALPAGSRIVAIQTADGIRIAFIACPKYKYVIAVLPGVIFGYRVPGNMPDRDLADIKKVIACPGVAMFRYRIPPAFDPKMRGFYLKRIITQFES